MVADVTLPVLRLQYVRAEARNKGGKWTIAQEDMMDTIRSGERMRSPHGFSEQGHLFPESHSQGTVC